MAQQLCIPAVTDFMQELYLNEKYIYANERCIIAVNANRLDEDTCGLKLLAQFGLCLLACCCIVANIGVC